MHSQKRWQPLSGALQNLHLMSSFLALAILIKSPFQNSSRENGHQQHFVSFPSSEKRQVVDESHRSRKKKVHLETLSFAESSGHLFLPGLPHGTTEMLDGANHLTQRR